MISYVREAVAMEPQMLKLEKRKLDITMIKTVLTRRLLKLEDAASYNKGRYQ
jgi:hypothetical protein